MRVCASAIIIRLTYPTLETVLKHDKMIEVWKNSPVDSMCGVCRMVLKLYSYGKYLSLSFDVLLIVIGYIYLIIKSLNPKYIHYATSYNLAFILKLRTGVFCDIFTVILNNSTHI